MQLHSIFRKYPAFWIVILIFLVVTGLYAAFKIKEDRALTKPDDVTIIHSWKLPQALEEISGIAAMDGNRIACIQDEKGIIYVFSTLSGKIEKEIPFAGEGDFEGISIAGNTAYILRSDGSLFEVENFDADPDPLNVRMYETTVNKADFEGLCYDEKNHRLLLLMKKNKARKDQSSRSVFAFDLRTKTMNEAPIYLLKPTPEIDGEENKFQPSEIALDSRGGMYVLKAKKPMIIHFKDEVPAAVYHLNEKQFPQPEGLTFGSGGTLFISSEGMPGKLFEVRLKSLE